MIDLYHLSFFQNAFLAGTVIAIISSLIGYFVVLRAQAFSAHALSHIGFAGATAAALFGVSSLVGTMVFTVLAALGMGTLGKRLQGRDIDTGMILSFSLGLGVLFLRRYVNSATEAVGVLFGSILSVTPNDVLLTLLVSVCSLFVLAILFRPLLFISIDPDVAEARGVPVQFVAIVFMLLLAMTVAVAIQIVGVLLVFALLIVPAAIAQHLTKRLRTGLICSVMLGLLFTWMGLGLAYFTPFPISFYIAVLAAGSYFIVVNLSHLKSPHRPSPAQHPSRETHWGHTH